MNSKVHSQGNVPFSWEFRPGESKAAPPQDFLADHFGDLLEPPPKTLAPPPCPPEHPRVVSFHDMPIPLPPCAFSHSFRSLSKKGLKKSDDPFLMAYKEVTEDNTKKGKFWSADRSVVRRKTGSKNVSFFTCKQSSSVLTEDSIMKLPQIPNSRLSRRETGD